MSEFVLGGCVQEEVRVDPARDWIENWQAELDSYYRLMQTLTRMEPSEVLIRLSAWSARASEMRSQLVRVDSRRSNAFRTREVDPFLDEIDRQFRVHSRLQSIRQHEWDMTRGL